MNHSDVIIVGGGPAGAACAWRLQQNKVNCLILEQSPFPRLKPCAGWITPEVLKDLQITADDYPHGIKTYTALHFSIRGFKFRLPTRQYAIRRIEFDNWLLHRSGAGVHTHQVRHISRTREGYILDGQYSARFLVGAGGTACPVYRSLFKPASPRDKGSLIVALEQEFLYPYTDERCLLWFLENGLPGYAWYVPKANGYVNVGIGGLAETLNASGDSIRNHWQHLIKKLERLGLVRGHVYQPVSHIYYLRQKSEDLRKDNAFLIGDAACLATRDMGEGIGPAIRSGLLAAEAILRGTDYTVRKIPGHSLWALLGLGRFAGKATQQAQV